MYSYKNSAKTTSNTQDTKKHRVQTNTRYALARSIQGEGFCVPELEIARTLPIGGVKRFDISSVGTHHAVSNQTDFILIASEEVQRLGTLLIAL